MVALCIAVDVDPLIQGVQTANKNLASKIRSLAPGGINCINIKPIYLFNTLLFSNFLSTVAPTGWSREFLLIYHRRLFNPKMVILGIIVLIVFVLIRTHKDRPGQNLVLSVRISDLTSVQTEAEIK
jgi:hypothetical protein